MSVDVMVHGLSQDAREGMVNVKVGFVDLQLDTSCLSKILWYVLC